MPLNTIAKNAKSQLSPSAQNRIEKLLDKGESIIHHSNLNTILTGVDWKELAKRTFGLESVFEINTIDDLNRLLTTPRFWQLTDTSGFIKSMFRTHYFEILKSEGQHGNIVSQQDNIYKKVKDQNETKRTGNKKAGWRLTPPSSPVPVSDSKCFSPGYYDTTYGKEECESNKEYKGSKIQRRSPRIMATPSAFPYLSRFPYDCLESFNGNEDKAKIDTTNVDKILSQVKENFTPKETKNIPNWNATLEEIINDTEIWLVTDVDRGVTQLPIFNRFSRNAEQLLVPRWINCGPNIKSSRNQGILAEINKLYEEINKLENHADRFYLLIIFLLIAYLRIALAGNVDYIGWRNLHLIDRYISTSSISPGETVIRDVVRQLQRIVNQPSDETFESASIRKMLKKLLTLFSKLWNKKDSDQKKLWLRELNIPEGMVEHVLNASEEISEGWAREIIAMIERHIGSLEEIEHINHQIPILKSKIADLRKKIFREGNNIQNAEEGTGDPNIDWLACYCPESGTIIMRIDYIEETYNIYRNEISLELFFQEILLHEFIHAALDLAPRNKYGKMHNFPKFQEICPESGFEFNEETLDNAIVLQVYKNSKFYIPIKTIISEQPYFYKQALYIDDSRDLIRLLTLLVAYKVHNGSRPTK